MKQLYDLLETIEQDKLHVAKLKKQLHHAESILEAHTAALTRLTTIPELSQPNVEKVDYSPAVYTRERITLYNWENLNIKVGDKVEVVVSGDGHFADNSVHMVTGVEDPDYDDYTFMHLDDSWYFYNDNGLEKDELYLIRTKEGSLNG